MAWDRTWDSRRLARQPIHSSVHTRHDIVDDTYNHRHLPERWGYAYFTDKPVNQSRRIRDGEPEEGPRDPLWPVKEALSLVYEAEKTYDALYGACEIPGRTG